MHVVAHRPCDQDAAGNTFGLKSRGNIDAVTVQVRAIGDHIAKVDADTKSDDLIRWVVAIMMAYLPLNANRAAHCPVNAVEHDE